VVVVEEPDVATFRSEMADAEVLLHVLEPVTAEVIAASPRLRLVQKIGVGVNTIDLDAASAHGVAVANMPGTNTVAVAEMTVLLMLAALRRVTELDRIVRGGGWAVETGLPDSFGELGGRTVGLVGYGAVARRLEPILTAFGATVIHCTRSTTTDPGGSRRPLDLLLAESDVVSLHLPLGPETSGLIGEDQLARMRRGSVLVNTARGGLVDQPALVSALRSGRLGAAGLDVFAQEPPGVGDELLALENVVMTPHVGWLTPETLARSLDVAVENCRRIRDGEQLLHRVV
jgi:phosphoglycerate dehydrogenase-like enzyme